MLYSFTAFFNKHDYTITYQGNKFCIQDNDAEPGTPCKIWVNVEPDEGYTFKVLKTKIKASGGARGLFSFITDAYKNNIMTTYADAIINKIITGYVKPAK